MAEREPIPQGQLSLNLIESPTPSFSDELIKQISVPAYELLTPQQRELLDNYLVESHRARIQAYAQAARITLF